MYSRHEPGQLVSLSTMAYLLGVTGDWLRELGDELGIPSHAGYLPEPMYVVEEVEHWLATVDRAVFQRELALSRR